MPLRLRNESFSLFSALDAGMSFGIRKLTAANAVHAITIEMLIDLLLVSSGNPVRPNRIRQTM